MSTNFIPSFHTVKTHVPIFDWLPKYNVENFKGDLNAGIVIFIMLIPQGMAYGVLAGMPPVYGLYCATIPLIVYGVFGTSRQMSLAAYAIISLLVQNYLVSCKFVEDTQAYINAAMTLSFVSGSLNVLFACLNLGAVISDFISESVIAGFISASAIVIMISQVGNLLGISVPKYPYVLETIGYLVTHLGEMHGCDIFISVLSLFLLQWSKNWKAANKKPSSAKLKRDKYFKYKAFIANMANLEVVALTMLLAYIMTSDGSTVNIVGYVPPGMLTPSAPSLSDFATLLPGAIVIAILSFLSNWAIAVKFSQMNGYVVIPNQEMLAVGFANVIGSFFHAFPTAGGLARSAANNEAGAKTPLSGIITASLISISLFALTKCFYYIPKSCLGAIIVISIVPLIDFDPFRKAYNMNQKYDFYSMLITFCGVLLCGVSYGFFIGAVFSVFSVAHKMGYPRMVFLGSKPAQVDMDAESVPESVHLVVKNLLTGSVDGDDAAVGLAKLTIIGACLDLRMFEIDQLSMESSPELPRQIPGVVILRMSSSLFFANFLSFRDCIKRSILGENHCYSEIPIKLVLIDTCCWSDVDMVGFDTLKSLQTDLRDYKSSSGVNGVVLAFCNSSNYIKNRLEGKLGGKVFDLQSVDTTPAHVNSFACFDTVSDALMAFPVMWEYQCKLCALLKAKAEEAAKAPVVDVDEDTVPLSSYVYLVLGWLGYTRAVAPVETLPAAHVVTSPMVTGGYVSVKESDASVEGAPVEDTITEDVI